ncbi:MAG: hypothetical protein UE699_02865 [Bacilli bacterium]|nr:hypothetical protein [Bacilli bacterium]
MLYEENQLTEEQAQQIIGEKMVARINFLNDWMSKNGYKVMLHSTWKEKVPDIMSKGLCLYTSGGAESKDDILENCSISEQNLNRLESWVKSNRSNGTFPIGFETYQPGKDTTVSYLQLSAKLLLGYNHQGADTTIVFCVPMKKEKRIGREVTDSFQLGTMRRYDPHLRRKITGKLQKDGSVEFESEYSYPAEGILFAFDRDKIKIKFNDRFDEEYYLDNTTPQRGKIHKGEVLQGLRNLERQNQNSRLNASGRSDSTAELTQMFGNSTTKTVGNATKTRMSK